MEAMDKVNKEIKRKRTGEACKEEGNAVAKGKARMLKNSEERKGVKTDIRNWFKKKETSGESKNSSDEVRG